MLGAGTSSVFADKHCDENEYDAIASELALCSTHAYNIGMTENPDSADREWMREVIALKTELVTQQMYKHYEQMRAMLNRFKTQMEKSVLQANLEAVGAVTQKKQEKVASARQTNPNIFMESGGIKDCINSDLDNEVVAKCFYSNYNVINGSYKLGETPPINTRKQLAKDFELVCGLLTKKEDQGDCTNTSCTNYKNLSNKEAFSSCMNKHVGNIRKANNNAQTEKANRNKISLR
jgi:hypothetical protein